MLEGLDDVLQRIDTIQQKIKKISGYDDRFEKAVKEKKAAPLELKNIGDTDDADGLLDADGLKLTNAAAGLTGSGSGFTANGANRLADAAAAAARASDVTSQAARFRPSAYGDAAFDGHIRQASDKYGLPFALIKAVVNTESQFNPNAVSHAGAQGLMQIMPQTGALLGLKNPFNARDNIMAGSAYLKDMMTRYNGNVPLALAAYNAGPGAVDAARGVPNFTETKAYVQKVLDYFGKYS